jgi:hypothetical protein
MGRKAFPRRSKGQAKRRDPDALAGKSEPSSSNLVVLPVSVWVSGIKRGKVWRQHGGPKQGGTTMPLGSEIVQLGADLTAIKKRSQ